MAPRTSKDGRTIALPSSVMNARRLSWLNRMRHHRFEDRTASYPKSRIAVRRSVTCFAVPMETDGKVGLWQEAAIGSLREFLVRNRTIADVGRPQTCLLFTCGAQSGRTSAPIIPHRVQTMRAHSDRTGVSSGSQSAFIVALWWHRPESQIDE
jgi:hypothetical protein